MRFTIGIGIGIMLAAAPAGADALRGWMQQPLQETEHSVEVKLDGCVAKLTVRRSFHNLGEIPEEANVDLTLPPGAVASSLRLRTKAGWETGTLMDAQAATGEYEELTGIGDHKVLKDPALLEWLDVGNLSLRVFPVPVGGEATVEYDLVMPTAYEEGKVVLYYPEPSGASAANLIRPDVRVGKGTLTRGVVLSEDEGLEGEDDAGEDDEATPRWSRVELAPPDIDVMVARYGVFTVNQDTAIWRLELDAAPELAPKPKKARVAFVVDASFSVGAAGITEQLALARGYMADLPDAKYEVILFRREALRLAGKFLTAGELEKVIARAGALDKLRPGNGSNLEAGLAAAADALAGALAEAKGKDKGASRIVAFTDGAMRLGFSPSLAVALLKRAPASTVVHVVRRPSAGEDIFLNGGEAAEPLAEERADGDPLAAVATAFGGIVLQISGRGESPADYAKLARGLVQPIRIDDFKVVSEGAVLDEVPGVLPAGAGVRHMMAVGGSSSAVRVSGKLWGEPWTLDVPIDGAYSQKVGTLMFGDEVFRLLSEDDARRVAFAVKVVSPYTSYLAIEPGVQPATQGVNRDRWGTIGSGDGTGFGYGAAGAGGGAEDYRDLEAMIESMLQPAAVSCGALDPLVVTEIEGALGSLEIEATDDEVVDVRVAGSPSAVVGTCLMEEAWTLALGREFSGHVTYHANLVRL